MAIGTPTRVLGPASSYPTSIASFTTSAFTPTAGQLLIAVTSSESPAQDMTAANSAIAVSNSHAGSWSWTTLTQYYVTSGANSNEQITLHYAFVPATPGSGTVTFTFNTGSNPTNKNRVIFITNIYSISGVDTSGTVIQSTSSAATASTHTLTLSTPVASSLVFAAIGDSFIGAGVTNIAPPTNHTELNEDVAGGPGTTGSINLETAYDNASAGTSVNWTNVSNGFGSGAIAVELRELSAGTPRRVMVVS